MEKVAALVCNQTDSHESNTVEPSTANTFGTSGVNVLIPEVKQYAFVYIYKIQKHF